MLVTYNLMFKFLVTFYQFLACIDRMSRSFPAVIWIPLTTAVVFTPY